VRFRNSSSPDNDLEINIAPLVDVVFLLLIFFAVTTTFSKEAALKIQLPESSEQAQKQDPHTLEINIGPEGGFAVKAPGDAAAKSLVNTSRETLRRAVQAAAGGRADLVAVIRADRRTPHESVVVAMDVARSLGLTRVTFATEAASGKAR
jgi:biopolymer transport protein ExbD